jgi:hypothetical protein
MCRHFHQYTIRFKYWYSLDFDKTSQNITSKIYIRLLSLYIYRGKGIVDSSTRNYCWFRTILDVIDTERKSQWYLILNSFNFVGFYVMLCSYLIIIVCKNCLYWIQHYVIKFVSDLRQVCCFLRVLRFPPPIKLTTTI